MGNNLQTNLDVETEEPVVRRQPSQTATRLFNGLRKTTSSFTAVKWENLLGRTSGLNSTKAVRKSPETGRKASKEVKPSPELQANFRWMSDNKRITTADRFTTELVKRKFEELHNKLSQRLQQNLRQSVKLNVDTTNSFRKTEESVGNNNNRKVLSKHEFHRLWQQVFGHTIELQLFDKLFDLMDHDKSNSVDETEFTVVVLFLLNKNNSESSKAELAFRLFDSNKNGTMCQSEFGEMLSIVLGTKLDNFLKIDKAALAFREFLKKEVTEELLDFYIETTTLISQQQQQQHQQQQTRKDKGRRTVDLPYDKAKALFDEFIALDSPREINISSSQRDKLTLFFSETDKTESVIESSVFTECVEEIKSLIEVGPLIRFRQSLRTAPYGKLTQLAWKELKLKDNEALDFDKFAKWAKDTPGLFGFFDQLQSTFSEALVKAAFSWAKKYANESMRSLNNEDIEGSENNIGSQADLEQSQDL